MDGGNAEGLSGTIPAVTTRRMALIGLIVDYKRFGKKLTPLLQRNINLM